jgi:hypothetical protein
MPTTLLAVAAALAIVDGGLRVWRPLRGNAAGNLLFLAIAWVPFFVLPHVRPHEVTALAALLGVLAMVDFSRMVGLSVHGRFFAPALVLTAASFPLGGLGHGAALSAIPVLALLVIAASGATGRESHGFLQKLCLAWLAVLAYGYLYAHAVLFMHGIWPSATGGSMLALIILVAKFGNVAWLAARRASGRTRIQLVASPLGGALGAWIVSTVWPALRIPYFPAVGLAIGLGLGAATRAHALIVADVTGEPERQRKGTMLFGFGLSLAIGYWLLALELRPGWT